MKRIVICLVLVVSLISTSSLMAQVIANQPPDMIVCDENNDGFAEFDLTLMEPYIVGSQDPTNLVTSFYVTQSDADNNLNPILNPTTFINTAPNFQTIFARLEDSSNGDYDTTSFTIVVEEGPVFLAVTPFEMCDDEVQDGNTQFDLNSQNTTITIGDPNLEVTYYGNQVDADYATNPLVSPYTNTVNPETIYVRIESGPTGCHRTFAMELLVVPTPEIFQPSPLNYCDPNNDGFGEFNLTDADLEITGGVPTGNLQVSYHYLLQDAVNGVLPLSTSVPYLNDVPFFQTVYVRLVDQTTGCYSLTTLDLIVLESPQIVQPSNLEICDDDGDGVAIFNLTLSEPELLNGLDPTLYTITYYENAALTIAVANPTAYANTPPSPQTIYIVVEDVVNGCQSQTSILLYVIATPVVTPVTDYEVLDTDGDGLALFDLTSKIPEILNGQSNVNVTFYETQADADANTNVIANPTSYINISNPQTIFTRLENAESCFATNSFELFVNPNLGIEDDYFVDLSVYPNPVNDVINISSEEPLNWISITNNLGQELYNAKVISLETQIDMSAYSNGIYFIKVFIAGKTLTKKFIKN